MLRKVAKILKKISGFMAHWDGMAVKNFLSSCRRQSRGDGLGLAERIRRDVEQYHFGSENKGMKCTISIGVSSCPDAGIKTIEDLIPRQIMPFIRQNLRAE